MSEALGLLDDEGFENEMLRTSEMTMELFLGGVISKFQELDTEQEVPEDFVQELRQVLRDHQQGALKRLLPSIKQQAAAIYAKEFSQEELARVRQLGKDPVMVKMRERNKVIAPQLLVLGAREMQATEPELEAKIKRLVSEHMAKKSNSDHQS